MSRGSAGRHAVVTLGGQWIKYAVQIVALIVFSRLLDPSDFGLIAMVTSIVGIAYVIGDVGLSLAALQADDLTDGQRSNLWWITAGIGLVIALAVVGLAPAVGALFDNPELVPVMAVLATIFLANGLGGHLRTELIRAQRYAAVAGIDVAAQVIGLVAGLGFILAGGDYWGLVVQQVVAAAVMALGLAWACPWRPGLPSRQDSMRKLLRFGGFTFAAQIVNYISSNADAVIIGHRYGESALGFYNRAFQLARVPVQQVAAPLTRVVLPHLSATKADPTAFAAAVARGQLVLVAILLAALSFIAGTAPSLVEIALGPGWDPAVDLTRALCLGGALQALQYIYYWVLLAHGRTEVLFYAELGARVAMVAAMLFAASYGVVWVALAAAAGQGLLLVMNIAVVGPKVNLAAGPLLLQAARPVTLFAAACGAAWWAGAFLEPTSVVIEFGAVSVVWILTCVAGLVIKPIRGDISALASYGRSLIRKTQ